ncbi:MAG: hypothetical protein ACYCPP_09300 [Nitrososphaerales archaeon]
MTTTITEKVTDMRRNAGENLQESSDKLNESLESVKEQLLTYGSQIQEYLGKVNANIDGYKFSIEKQGDGLLIDIAFRAMVHPRTSKITK